MRRTGLLVTTLLTFIWGCDDGGKKQDAFNAVNTNNNTLDCTDGQRQCFANTVQICENKQWVNETLCGIGANAGLPVCDPASLSCRQCVSGGTACGDDNHVHVCDSDGTIGMVQSECDSTEGEQCVGANGVAACDSPCVRATSSKSYRGCEYWGSTTANEGLDPAFADNFAFAVDNSNAAPVRVRISGAGAGVDQVIPANTLQVVHVNFDPRLKAMESPDGFGSGVYTAASGSGGFHIQTSLPVTVYQFNPYDYVTDGGTNSYSNDASLLLPVSVLSRNYMIMSRPTHVLNYNFSDSTSPGFVTVVATADNTQVTVRSSAHTTAGDGIPALTPGGTATVTLNRGDAFQLISGHDLTAGSCPTGPGSDKETTLMDGTYCNPGNAYDLTGTQITATLPVAVFSGHNCVFVPFNAWACDHLEEMVFPQETWGKHFYVGLTRPVEDDSTETNLVRVLAGEDAVTVTFTPAAVSAPVTLNQGEFVEVMPEPGAHFEIEATGPVLVGKFVVGQNYWASSMNTDAAGDPAFGLVVPVEQFRSEYSFATPPSMTVNYVTVIARIPADTVELIQLDGQGIPASAFTPIGSDGWGVARIDVTASGSNGSHRITAPNETIKFGIEVYGFASYTSYLYPGGLDLEYINPIGK